MYKMEVINRPVESLIPYTLNNRTHPAEQVARIANSIAEFGFNQPIVIDELSVVLVGHGRLMAAQKLGLKEVPTLKLENLSEAKKRAYRILDNKLQNDSEWELDNLKLELDMLEEEGFALEPWGLDSLLPEDDAAEVVEDEFEPEEIEEPFIKQGDLIELGEHRLLCGDSAVEEHIDRLLDGTRVQCIVTDPPYGVSVAAKNRRLNTVQKAGRCLEDILDDDLPTEELEERLLPAFELMRTLVMADDCTLLVTAPQNSEIPNVMTRAGLAVRHVLVWVKNQPTFSMGALDYDYKHEPIFLTWAKRHKRLMKGDHRTTVWEIDKPRKCDKHPTMKPVELYVNAYLNHSEKGDSVFDAYSGSGTAFIAAEQLGRKCYGMEISPKYCQVILERYKAYCEKEGKPFVCRINGEAFDGDVRA